MSAYFDCDLNKENLNIHLHLRIRLIVFQIDFENLESGEFSLHKSVISNDFFKTRDMSGCVTFLSEWSEMSLVSDHHKY